MNKHIKAQNLVKQFSTFNITHISKFVVDFNFIMMSKPKYIVFFMSLFCSVVTSNTSHFYLFFFVNVLARADFWYDNLGFWLGKPRPKTINLSNKWDTSILTRY